MQKSFVLFVLVFVFHSCASQHQVVEGIQKIEREDELRYYLFYPEDYEPGGKPMGLLLFLHGGGESGQALTTLKKNGPPKMMADGYPFPFLVLAPQNPYEKKWWDVRAVYELLQEVIATNNVDTQRIYLTGLSRGGSAAWELAVQYPDTFAALAVVCGMAPTPYAHWINKSMPIWVFHGDEDPVIPVSESDAMVAKLKALGRIVKYDRFKGVGHNSWDRAYANDSLYTWLAQQKLNK